MQTAKSYSITEVCAATSLGRTLIFSAIKKGELKAKKIGRRTIVLEPDLSAWLNNARIAGGAAEPNNPQTTDDKA